MSSSEALTNNGGSSAVGFSQSGQLDWVALSRFSMSCTLEVAARLCKAGVETATVLVGSAIGSSFSFPPAGQMELTKSLSGLKGASSYSKLLWFGFGLQHVVKDLTNTEEGATCVAISAALSVPYSPFQAAQVWRQLCQLTGAPRQLTPSIHQWAALVEVCSGSLVRSKFPMYFDIFGRLLAPDDKAPRAPAPPDTVAKALQTIACLSRGTLVSATFVGGMECGWLAAVTSYLFDLAIEIQDENGERIHFSSNGSLKDRPQAIFRRAYSPNQRTSQTVLISQRLSYIGSGQRLLRVNPDSLSHAVQIPTKWSNIFPETFPQWNLFCAEPLRTAFVEVVMSLCHHSILHWSKWTSPDTAETRWNSFWWLQLLPTESLYHPRCCGNELLNFARVLLPSVSLPENLALSDVVDATLLAQRVELGLQRIRETCNCLYCCEQPSKPEEASLGSEGICYERLALTAVRFLLILSPTTLHESVGPSSTALWQLYNNTIQPRFGQANTLPEQRLALILFLLAGRLPAERVSGRICAAAAGGVCVFLALLKDINLSPIEATYVEVMPGHISHENQHYEIVQDADVSFDQSQLSWRNMQSANEKIFELNVKDFELVLHDHERKAIIGASYMSVNAIENDVCISIGALQASLQAAIKFDVRETDTCKTHCSAQRTGGQWSVSVSTALPASLQPAVCSSWRESNWAIVNWEIWNLVKQEATQWVDIQLFKISTVAIFVILLNLRSRVSRYRNQAQLMVSKFNQCTECVVQAVVVAAAAGMSEMAEPRMTVFDGNLKKGAVDVRYHCVCCGSVRNHVEFELHPAPMSTRRPRLLSGLRNRLPKIGK